MASLKGHTKKVTGVTFTTTLTAEGLPTHIVSASLDKSVRVWTPSGGKTVYSAAGNLAMGAEVNALALHPSSTLVASASADGSVSLHDLATDKPTTLLTIPLVSEAAAGTASTAIQFHPDGVMIGVGQSDANIRIFQVLTGACVASFATAGSVTSLAFSENGYILAAACEGSSNVELFDLRKLTKVSTIELPSANVITSLKFDISAQFLAVVGTDLRVFASKTLEQLLIVEENTAEITGVAWGVDSQELAISGMDRTVRIIGVQPASE